MARRTRAEMLETRELLLATARKVFSEQGYAEASMDDLTAQAGLTRGALYHHFGDKKGLLSAVVEQIDAEMDSRLQALSVTTDDLWQGFIARCRLYLTMAQEPEIQRIVLRDARAILGNTTPETSQYCIESMQTRLEMLMQQKIIVEAASEALALLIHGSLSEAAVWIAAAEDIDTGQLRLTQSLAAMTLLLNGLRNQEQSS
nr:TetR family transcriptional regulator [uncultured Moellerella sp.]